MSLIPPFQPFQPLRGKTIVVTRPRAQAGKLSALIAAQGGQPFIFPLLDISPAEDLAALQAAIAQLEHYSLAIFVSPNAVDFSLPAILAQRAWPSRLQAATMGQSSVTQLASYGVDQAIAPSERFDSESLLELPEFQAAHLLGQRIVIFRGNGGRAFLGDTLRERGAEVSYVTCYHRSAPGDAAELMVLWQNGRLDGLAISSSEGLRNLAGLLDAGGREHLSRTPVFVPHQRIAEVAAELGLQQIILTGPADAGIIAGLREYHWR